MSRTTSVLALTMMILLFSTSRGISDDASPDEFCKLYPYLTAVYVGPLSVDEEENSIRFHRLVIAVSEVYTSIYIERLRADEELVNKVVESQYHAPLELFYDSTIALGRIINDVNLIEWESYSRAIISLDRDTFEIEMPGLLDSVTVKRLK